MNTKIKVSFYYFPFLMTVLVLGIWGWAQGQVAKAQESSVTRRINVPYTSALDNLPVPERAVFWFGQVDTTTNYADGRLIYNDEKLYVTLHIFDYHLWYDETPIAGDLSAWDSATLYLKTDGNPDNTLTADTYRFVAQLNHEQDRQSYQAAYQGNGSSDWTTLVTPFETTTGWRGSGLNNGAETRGWRVTFKIPFTSLGLAQSPPAGTVWRLALAVHDRDDANGAPIADQTWPETITMKQPATWGEMRFGIPAYSPPFAAASGTATIRNGVSGATVVDAHVGGHSDCGNDSAPLYFDSWGSANYAGYTQINVQNQWDVADWPCFSRYYILFPLDAIPAGKVILSAKLKMYQFGNAGQGWQPGPEPSLIQVMTVAEDWNENEINWNNGPMALENVAASWIGTLDTTPPWPGVEREWDVSRATAAAYEAGETLRLALYSADDGYHSGKYFYSSDADVAARPMLEVVYGNRAEPVGWAYLPLVSR